MSCNLDIGLPVEQAGSLSLYKFHFPAKGTLHQQLSVFFAHGHADAPGYIQIWRWDGSAWVIAGTDYLDTLNPDDSYSIWLSTASGWSTPYDCAAPAASAAAAPSNTGPIIGITVIGLLALGIIALAGKK
jgi:hypothetical protein